MVESGIQLGRFGRAAEALWLAAERRSVGRRGAGVNWDAIGAIAELIGALGVILSLLYLALQVRQSGSQVVQNTAAVRASTYQSIVDTVANHGAQFLQNERLADITFRGGKDYQSLTDAERRLFDVNIANFLQAFSAAQYHYESGLLPKDEWYGFRNLLAFQFQSPGNRAAWKTVHPIFPPRFQELVRRIQERNAELAAQQGAAPDEPQRVPIVP
jgi:hypothetical protein